MHATAKQQSKRKAPTRQEIVDALTSAYTQHRDAPLSVIDFLTEKFGIDIPDSAIGHFTHPARAEKYLLKQFKIPAAA